MEEHQFGEFGRPSIEYGEWRRDNAGMVGRTVTRWVWSALLSDWVPVVTWENMSDDVRISIDAEDGEPVRVTVASDDPAATERYRKAAAEAGLDEVQ